MKAHANKQPSVTMFLVKVDPDSFEIRVGCCGEWHIFYVPAQPFDHTIPIGNKVVAVNMQAVFSFFERMSEIFELLGQFLMDRFGRDEGCKIRPVIQKEIVFERGMSACFDRKLAVDSF